MLHPRGRYGVDRDSWRVRATTAACLNRNPVTGWDHAVSKALDREDKDCAICLGGFELEKSDSSPEKAWLSCSHVFHSNCIAKLELLTLDKGQMPLCPVCRRTYTKQFF